LHEKGRLQFLQNTAFYNTKLNFDQNFNNKIRTIPASAVKQSLKFSI